MMRARLFQALTNELFHIYNVFEFVFAVSQLGGMQDFIDGRHEPV